VIFSVQALGDNLRYEWFFNGQPLPDATNAVLLVREARDSDAGTYFARVFQGNRFVDSRGAILQLLAEESEPPLELGLAADKFGDVLGRTNEFGLGLARARGGMRAAAAAPASVVNGYSGNQVFSTYGAASERGEPVHCGVVGGASQWFTYTAPASGTLFISTEGSSFDTILAVYTGPGTSFSTLVKVDCDNNSGANGKTSKLDFPATAGTRYYIVVDGVGGATGTVRLKYRLLVPMVLSRVWQTNGSLRFRVTTTPAYPFTIQRSSNMLQWISLLTTSAASGTFSFGDSNGLPGRHEMFYRATQRP
jgi:hypothetical protein